MKKALVKEIFASIQGEGLYVGEKQLFVRFAGCNLNCSYCDTDYDEKTAREYSVDELYFIIREYMPLTISFTGGEPLLQQEFLKEFLEKYGNLPGKIYLETNGTLHKELKEIVDYVDILAQDIKLESAGGEKTDYESAEEFLKQGSLSKCTNVFLKIVFDEKITDVEIEKCCIMAKKYNTPIVLQPKMPIGGVSDYIEEVFEKFFSRYKNIRLIPQMHKFLNIR